jgi:hypothetical protein
MTDAAIARLRVLLEAELRTLRRLETARRRRLELMANPAAVVAAHELLGRLADIPWPSVNNRQETGKTDGAA